MADPRCRLLGRRGADSYTNGDATTATAHVGQGDPGSQPGDFPGRGSRQAGRIVAL